MSLIDSRPVPPPRVAALQASGGLIMRPGPARLRPLTAPDPSHSGQGEVLADLLLAPASGARHGNVALRWGGSAPLPAVPRRRNHSQGPPSPSIRPPSSSTPPPPAAGRRSPDEAGNAGATGSDASPSASGPNTDVRGVCPTEDGAAAAAGSGITSSSSSTGRVQNEGDLAGDDAVRLALEGSTGTEAACKLLRGLMLMPGRRMHERRQLQYILETLEKVIDSSERNLKAAEDIAAIQKLENAGLDAETCDYLAGFVSAKPVSAKKHHTLRQVVGAVIFACRIRKAASPRVACRAASSLSQASVPAEASEGLHEALEDINSIMTFDIFKVDELSRHKPLSHVGLAVMDANSLLREFNLPRHKFKAFIAEIEGLYNENPYHNCLHAAEVAQTVHTFLLGSFCQWSELEVMSTLVAAMCHDVAHPGVTNAFRITTLDEEALTYNDKSVNENMHSAVMFRCIQREGTNWMAPLSREQFVTIRKVMIDIILATDMAFHSDHLKKYRQAVEHYGKDPSKWESASLELEFMTHVADISSTTKPLPIADKWTDRLLNEFFMQGDKEWELGLPISPLCDRQAVLKASSQIGFVNFIVMPSLKALAETCSVEESMKNLEAYHEDYTKRAAIEKQEEPKPKRRPSRIDSRTSCCTSTLSSTGRATPSLSIPAAPHPTRINSTISPPDTAGVSAAASPMPSNTAGAGGGGSGVGGGGSSSSTAVVQTPPTAAVSATKSGKS